MTDYIVTDTHLTNIADSLRFANSSSDTLEFPNEFISTASKLTNPSKPDDVRFIDYDNTILYQYTKEQFLQLTSMPPNPDRTSEGLTSQGWNWNLTDAKAQVTACDKVDIGQMYIPTDGKTHIFVEIPDSGVSSDYLITLRLRGNQSLYADVDWGDDTTEAINVTTQSIERYHTYSNSGSYEITLSPRTGKIIMTGSNGSFNFFGPTGSSYNNYNYANQIRFKKVHLGNNFEWDNCSFQVCVGLEYITIPSSMNSFSGSEFAYCRVLENVIFPSGTTSLTGQFYENDCLKNVSLPYSLTEFINGFGYCYSINRLVIPNRVTSAPGFHYNNSIQEVVLPSSITSLGDYFLEEVRSFRKIKIPSTVTSIGSRAFSYCYCIKEIELNNSITSIGSYAFNSCQSLKKINTLGSITQIAAYTFQSCHVLENINIPNTVTTIGNSAFSGCYSMTKITIPANVTSIGSSAFAYCVGMKEYHFLPTSPPTLGANAFTGIKSGCKIYVPKSTNQTVLNAYKAASNWSSYASYIEEEPE